MYTPPQFLCSLAESMYFQTLFHGFDSFCPSQQFSFMLVETPFSHANEQSSGVVQPRDADNGSGAVLRARVGECTRILTQAAKVNGLMTI